MFWKIYNGERLYRGELFKAFGDWEHLECYERGLSFKEVEKHSFVGSGLLEAKKILPKGPSYGNVQEGDTLYTVNGQSVTSLSQFEQLLDVAVGEVLQIQAHHYRHNARYELKVQNLWEFTTCRLLWYAGSVFQPLGYQTAIHYNVPIESVLLSNADGSFTKDGPDMKIISSLGNQSTHNIDAFIKVAGGIR